MTTSPRRESELLLYTARPDGAVKVGVLFHDETAWLSQKALAELSGVGVPAIAKHLKNIFESGELDPVATVSKMEMVRTDGAREARAVEYLSLLNTERRQGAAGPKQINRACSTAGILRFFQSLPRRGREIRPDRGATPENHAATPGG